MLCFIFNLGIFWRGLWRLFFFYFVMSGTCYMQRDITARLYVIMMLEIFLVDTNVGIEKEICLQILLKKKKYMARIFAECHLSNRVE